MNRRISTIALTVLISVAGIAQIGFAGDLRGGGSWNSDGEAKRGARQWDLDVQRAEDGSISGMITVADSPLFTEGRVQGTFDGHLISGAIVGEDGQQVATFNGLLTNGRFQGKYTDRTGETGEWEWEGALPR